MLPLARRDALVRDGDEVGRLAVDGGADAAALRVARELVVEADGEGDLGRGVATARDLLVQVYLRAVRLRGDQGEGAAAAAVRAFGDDAGGVGCHLVRDVPRGESPGRVAKVAVFEVRACLRG